MLRGRATRLTGHTGAGDGRDCGTLERFFSDMEPPAPMRFGQEMSPIPCRGYGRRRMGRAEDFSDSV